MLNQSATLDPLFKALGDPTRREMVERISLGPVSVSQLAEPLHISLPAVLQHLAILQECGLVRSEKIGRIRTCRIEPVALRSAEAWFSGQRARWEHRLDRLAEVLAEPEDAATPNEVEISNKHKRRAP